MADHFCPINGQIPALLTRNWCNWQKAQFRANSEHVLFKGFYRILGSNARFGMRLECITLKVNLNLLIGTEFPIHRIWKEGEERQIRISG